jgi:hypothetical protein
MVKPHPFATSFNLYEFGGKTEWGHFNYFVWLQSNWAECQSGLSIHCRRAQLQLGHYHSKWGIIKYTEQKCKVLVPCFMSWNIRSQKCFVCAKNLFLSTMCTNLFTSLLVSISLLLKVLWPTDVYLYSQSCEIHRLGPDEFISIDWFHYMNCNSVKS